MCLFAPTLATPPVPPPPSPESMRPVPARCFLFFLLFSSLVTASSAYFGGKPGLSPQHHPPHESLSLSSSPSSIPSSYSMSQLMPHPRAMELVHFGCSCCARLVMGSGLQLWRIEVCYRSCKPGDCEESRQEGQKKSRAKRMVLQRPRLPTDSRGGCRL